METNGKSVKIMLLVIHIFHCNSQIEEINVKLQ